MSDFSVPAPSPYETVLITGGSGNLGQLVTRQLQALGCRALSFDLPDATAQDTSPDTTIIAGDIRDTDLLRDVMTTHRPDAILHLASMLSGSSEENPTLAWQVNAEASVRFMQAAIDLQTGPFVFASTVGTYGRGVPDPLPEDTPQWPENVYGATKVAVERMGVYFKARHGLDFRCVRFPMVLSPFAPAGALSAYPSHAFTAAAQGRPFTFPVAPGTGMSNLFIDDVTQSLVQLLHADRANLRQPVYNLHGFTVTAGQIAAAILQKYPDFMYNFAPNPAIDAMISNAPDVLQWSSASRDWNWAPKFDFVRCSEAMFAYVASRPDQ